MFAYQYKRHFHKADNFRTRRSRAHIFHPENKWNERFVYIQFTERFSI